MERASITASTDDETVAKGLSDLGEAIHRKIPLYVDVNTGLNRMGREPGQPTAELVKRIWISALPGVEVVGLMTHGGHTGQRNSMRCAVPHAWKRKDL
ncbi:alanine racemase [Paenibacillus mendelii]|uniref:Alanine racemase n=1 Tax=Paenibacillus mendelii TaxID=206163 RepID=A0ABV6J288_9BACL|nr:alanine racemase [Paenibacillus mendelii]MCQ6560526.1 alanine racemase [Paenibacillus mendelii]